ncbi:putative bifunctional diguanylate cyclase/phosphodiesterase [Butyrivibrio sp. AE3004]|uniref:putative bifunctional diguanylate cyclase/phosphodiesterase n=1 Tax=Butyrivibrio sp. AE3004 TaxID=1506994 RepID=UPI000494D573|nr:EAL domain-containing protein [Butyrivibrio sp. AE3004]
MDLMSPVTIGLVLVLIISKVRKLYEFKWPVLALAAGILVWFIGDILFFFNDFVVDNPGSLTDITDFIYLFPNALFALSISIYMIHKLLGRRNDLAFLMINTLCFAIIGFVLIFRFHQIATGYSGNFTPQIEIVFFFISFYTIMMCLQLVSFVGVKNLRKGTMLVSLGIFGYAILDIEYDFLQSLGIDAENNFVNLLYVLFMILMTVGTTIQQKKKYEFDFRSGDYSEKATGRRFAITIIIIMVDLLFIATRFLPESLGVYIIITLLSYLIVNYILHSNYLNEELIHQQSEQNAILEERIKEKTRDLEKANDNLQIMASTDALTGLKNRRSSEECMKELWMTAMEKEKKYAIFIADLNHFKPVNDTYGHEMGDKVLIEFGKRLNSLPENFSAFRVGGDEFLISLFDIKNQDEVIDAAKELRNLFNTPIIFDSYIFNLSASLGIAIFPDDSEDYEALMNYADAAMYEVKKSGNKDGYKFFDSKLTNVVLKKKTIQKVLETARVDRDFLLHFQPQFDISTGKIIGAEVFLHLDGDMEHISPEEFVPIAEETGLISSLSIWTAKTAMATVSEWNKKLGTNIGFTLNLSPVQLLDAEFIETLEHLSDDYKFDMGKIVLDISNEVIVGATYSAKETLEAFHNYGFALSLNDFGGKNINLSYLMDCGINFIELSRNLIAGVGEDNSTEILIRSILNFAGTMGIAVSAVGIETVKQYEILKNLGITKMQGYLLGKPMRAEEFEKVLMENMNERLK